MDATPLLQFALFALAFIGYGLWLAYQRESACVFGVIVLLVFACGCASIGGIGFYGSYEDQQGETFKGGVNIELRDAKTVKPPNARSHH